ncbi:hypothetical protein jhhlp_002332 [Lomentospora prolificans]|uniref:Yeast cell wall synthesis Kre9/Knh1-like N-terminal domain-containing protein n=1 Tax=Lomentospora prolificans TaxID=41688 RepID=A0A2N3NDT1_9PEZI|nr:hypothetical protein jhhlp_002332 [Lomentospora prolificans]
MQFTISAAALLAFVSTALAQTANFDVIRAPTEDEIVPAGKTYTITWDAAPATYDDQTVTIVLLGGSSPGSLVPADEPVAAGIVNSLGSYEWAVASDLGKDAVYGLRIQLDSDDTVFQYSFPFHIEASDDGGNSTTTAPSSTKKGTTSTTEAPEPTGASNSTTKATPPKTTLTKTTGGESTPTSTGDSEQAVPSNGATRSAAGAVAILGGLAVAALGL